MPWVKVQPVWNKQLIGICGYPYYGHSHGCSNFCKRIGCPPTMVPLEIALDECYFIYIRFPIGKHVKRMGRLHPNWSIYQAQNIYYWQGKARKILRGVLEEFLESHSKLIALGPKIHLDSWGIDMTATLAKVGIILQWGEDWGLRKETYVLRYAGFPLSKCGPRRLANLQKMYPAIYARRLGKCAACQFRPCLKYATYNASLFVGKKLGTFYISKFLPKHGWIIRCDCGRRKLAPLDKPLCVSLQCKCANKQPSKG